MGKGSVVESIETLVTPILQENRLERGKGLRKEEHDLRLYKPHIERQRHLFVDGGVSADALLLQKRLHVCPKNAFHWRSNDHRDGVRYTATTNQFYFAWYFGFGMAYLHDVERVTVRPEVDDRPNGEPAAPCARATRRAEHSARVRWALAGLEKEPHIGIGKDVPVHG